MKYLSAEEILLIHSIVIEQIGGSHGVRDISIIKNCEHSPRQAVFGKELHPTIFLKAAVYARNIIMEHPFVDGNKRAGMTVAMIFLENNGHRATAEKGSIADFALKIVVSHLDLKEIAAWLEDNVKKTK